jgi:hypothetical protein
VYPSTLIGEEDEEAYEDNFEDDENLPPLEEFDEDFPTFSRSNPKNTYFYFMTIK